MKVQHKILDFIDDYSDLVTTLFIILLFFFIALFLAIKLINYYDNKTIEEINNISNNSNVLIYNKCYKLQNKFYCIIDSEEK